MDRDRATEIVRRVPRLDARWRIDEEDMPETPLHDHAIDLLVQVLRERIARTGENASVHRNLAVRFDRARPMIGCDPDMCVHRPAIPEDETSIRLWLSERSAPTLAVEIVSAESGRKDSFDNPDRVAARVAESFHRETFAMRLGLSTQDLRSLDGTTVANEAAAREQMNNVLRDVTGPEGPATR